jgi:hypothetical protein
MLAPVSSCPVLAAAVAVTAFLSSAQSPQKPASPKPIGADREGRRIDRRALADRHAPVLRQFDAEAPLSLGNGEFAFTADVTGLQTFPDAFNDTIPLGTLSNWGWHTAPNPRGWSIDTYEFAPYESHGSKVG